MKEKIIRITKDGKSDFKNIQDAVDSISLKNNIPVKIFLANGVYEEKIFIEKPLITIIGESKEKTIITFSDHSKKEFQDGKKFGTFNSYTFFIGGDDFTAENITFENSAGSGDIVGQALACYADADKIKFKNCIFLGCQDTLFTGPLPPSPIIPNGFFGPRENAPRRVGRQYYENCFIKGDIDFIFGSARAVFNNCEIFSNNRNKEINGYITAASTPVEEDAGYLFLNCRLTGDAWKDTVYLGRPWREYAKVAFLNCWMGEHIKKEGWHNWDKPDAEKNTIFAEFNSSGPGGRMDQRVGWSKILTEEESKKYSIENILAGYDGWDPKV